MRNLTEIGFDKACLRVCIFGVVSYVLPQIPYVADLSNPFYALRGKAERAYNKALA